jgi:DNA-directed RNA polymerase subunit RPC12/RpoP
MKDKILTMQVQCLRGHKSVRRLSEHQAAEMAPEVFKRLYTCTDCGSNMTLIEERGTGTKIEGVFLCPIHGPQKREFPRSFHATVELAGADVDSPRSIIDSFRCPQCSLVYAITAIDQRQGVLEVETRCANGHKATRYLPRSLDTSLLKNILQRVVHCDRCGLPGHITDTEDRGNITRLTTACPIHGTTKKDILSVQVELLREAVSEIPEDAVVKSSLTSHDCRRALAIRSIEEGKQGYKLKCVCPGTKVISDRILPLTWNEPVIKRITSALLTCDECGHPTHILDKKKLKNKTGFRIVCPVHGVMTREAPHDVFKLVEEHQAMIDRMPSIVRSLSCEKCSMPMNVRDVEERRGLIEFDVDCRNGHRSKRLFVPGLDQKTLTGLYKKLYQCPECYESLDLVYIEPRGREDRVVLLCPLHGKIVLDIPPDHAEAMQSAYNEMQEDKIKPPVEAVEHETSEILEASEESHPGNETGVVVLRGCEIVGGKFDFKVKIKNESGYVITNATVSIVAYPQDCMELTGENVKAISRIEVDGFRSPQFTFYPTKDCVQGKVVATVSYIDFLDQLHTVSVEPYLIRSVCDLLQPLKKTSEAFELLLTGLEKTQQEQTLDWNAQVLFTKAEKILPAKNFHIVDSDETIVRGEFIGTIRGYAEGKYTQKKVAIILLITGPENGRHSCVRVEALGEDVAMLPTTIDELADTMDSWICLRCGAPLEPEQVEEMGRRLPIRCKYCVHTLTIALYLQ